MTYLKAPNKDFVELLKGLEAVRDVKGTRFAFLVAKNIKEISYSLRQLEETATPTQEFQKVAAQAHALAESEDLEAMEKLEEDNQPLIEARKAQLKALEDMMDDEREIALDFIKEDQLPADLSTDQLLPLLRIIEA
jgi:flagellar motor component MotA